MKKITLLFLLFSYILQSYTQTPQLTVQTGHGKPVTTICFHPDNKFIATGAFDNTIKLWDTESGKLLRTFYGHQHAITSLDFNQQGNILMSGSYDTNLRLWDITTGKCIATLPHKTRITRAVFHSNGKIIASASKDGDIKIWDAGSYKLLQTLNRQNGCVNDIGFTSDGKQIVAATQKRGVIIWNLIKGEIAASLTDFETPVNQISCHPENNTVICLLENHTIEMWDLDTKKKIRTSHYAENMQLVSLKLFDIQYTTNGKNYAASASNGKIVFWDTKNGQLINTIAPDSIPIQVFATNKAGNKTAIAKNNTVELHFLNTNKPAMQFAGIQSGINSLSITPDNTLLAGCNRTNHITIWNYHTGKKTCINDNEHTIIECVNFHPRNKKQILAAYHNSEIKLWDISKKEILQTYTIHSDRVNCIDFRIDGKYFVSGGHDKKVIMHETQTGRIMRTYTGHTDIITDVTIGNKGKYIASASWDNTVRIWDIDNNRLAKELKHGDDVWCVSFSADDKYLLTGCSDKTVLLWETETGKLIRTFKGHNDYVSRAFFLNDNQTVVSASWDRTIKLWDTNSGKCIKTLAGHQNYIKDLVITNNNKHLISCGFDNQLKIWNLETGTQLLSSVNTGKNNDFVVTTTTGYFDGTNAGIRNSLHYVQGLEVIPLESLFEQCYIPGLWERTINNETLDLPDLDLSKTIKLPPKVQIINHSPLNEDNFSDSETFKLTVAVTNQGGGIDEIRLYHNNKLVENTIRAFRPVEDNNNTQTIDYALTLVNGLNTITATAFNNKRIESIPHTLHVFYKGNFPASKLYVFTIAINNYLNDTYDLQYARTDADAFMKQIQSGGNGIYKQIIPYQLFDSNATKPTIAETFKEIAAQALPNDVFVFYYAGHGAMSENDSKTKQDFYLIPYDVTQIYGDNQQLRNKAVASQQIVKWSQEIKARKQLIMFDACHSGGAVEALTSRGAAEQKAIIQLARSAGTAILASSGTEQFSGELKELGHGIFTYAILEALQGKADGGGRDSKITVNEIKAYLEDRVPELTQKYRGQTQYPTGYISGQDFPIVIQSNK